VYPLPLSPDKPGMQVSIYFETLKFEIIIFLDKTFILWPPKSRDRLIVVIEQGGTAEAALDAMDRTINSITRPQCFSYWRPNSDREIAEEQ
jgi:hypothetical protein